MTYDFNYCRVCVCELFQKYLDCRIQKEMYNGLYGLLINIK